MKRTTNHLLQHLHGRLESSRVAQRNAAPRSIAAHSGLRAEDGYDWLRQIKPTQAARQAGHRG